LLNFVSVVELDGFKTLPLTRSQVVNAHSMFVHVPDQHQIAYHNKSEPAATVVLSLRNNQNNTHDFKKHRNLYMEVNAITTAPQNSDNPTPVYIGNVKVWTTHTGFAIPYEKMPFKVFPETESNNPHVTMCKLVDELEICARTLLRIQEQPNASPTDTDTGAGAADDIDGGSYKRLRVSHLNTSTHDLVLQLQTQQKQLEAEHHAFQHVPLFTLPSCNTIPPSYGVFGKEDGTFVLNVPTQLVEPDADTPVPTVTWHCKQPRKQVTLLFNSMLQCHVDSPAMYAKYAYHETEELSTITDSRGKMRVCRLCGMGPSGARTQLLECCGTGCATVLHRECVKNNSKNNRRWMCSTCARAAVEQIIEIRPGSVVYFVVGGCTLSLDVLDVNREKNTFTYPPQQQKAAVFMSVILKHDRFTKMQVQLATETKDQARWSMIMQAPRN
jgi:hypothetical protein